MTDVRSSPDSAGHLKAIVDAYDKFEAEQLQLDEGVEQAISAARAFLRASQPATPTAGGEATKEAQKRYPDDADDYGHPESLKHLRDAFMAGASFEKETSARSSADSEQPDARYWEFRQKVENLVFDPIRRGGRVEDEILSELERMSQRDAEALRAPDPAQPSAVTAEPVALINARLADLAEANSIYGKDERLGAPDKVARNEREILWLKDLRSAIQPAPPKATTKMKICSVCGAKHPVGEK